jgi:BMFP domain-containing protein YqiC
MRMVDVPTKEDFDALTARVAALEAKLEIPQDVKDALLKVLEWLKATV